jgi:hypothetical protein
VIELDGDFIGRILRMSAIDNIWGQQHENGDRERRQRTHGGCDEWQYAAVQTAVGHRTVLAINDSAQ